MHTYSYKHTTFTCNSDYSGDIHIRDADNPEIKETLIHDDLIAYVLPTKGNELESDVVEKIFKFNKDDIINFVANEYSDFAVRFFEGADGIDLLKIFAHKDEDSIKKMIDKISSKTY